MKQRTSKKLGFSQKNLHQKREPHPMYYLSQRTTFWIAAFSVIAFVAGNMVGTHGWYAFWKSVMGRTDDSLIVYTGTVSPIAQVPDYEKWAKYGGDPSEHTFKQVPSHILIDLPNYNSAIQRRNSTQNAAHSYSVSHLGSYSTGRELSGSHPGVDIRTPVGTPIVSIANGVVDDIKDGGGFGKVIVIRHPNAPDPRDPTKTTTLYSAYAHLSAIYASKEMIVQKGQHIGDSGRSGFASGPHLHFQIDLPDAPFHPYWPFSGAEARNEGMSLVEAVNAGLFRSRAHLYTINPMVYVQANYEPVTTLIAHRANEDEVHEPRLQEEGHVHNAAGNTVGTRTEKSAEELRAEARARTEVRRQERIRQRLARQVSSQRSIAKQEPTEPEVPMSTVQYTEVVATVTDEAAVGEEVHAVEIAHDGTFSGRGWETVTITLLDSEGNVVKNPKLEKDLHLRTAYGSAEFRPAQLSPLDFVEGQAKVHMLPRGRRTIVLQVKPFHMMSSPMVYRR